MGCDGNMLKFIKNIVYVLVCLILLEICMYNKDYNELISFTNYIKYDLESQKIESFSTGKYDVKINDNEFTVILHREAIFNFKFLTKIDYHGII